MEPVTVRTNVAAATSGFFMGRREQLIANELNRGGIPAVAGPNGITVPSGTLEVSEEEGMRVFKWTPPEEAEGQPEQEEPEHIKLPVPAGDDNLEVRELRKQSKKQRS